jgi:hypothetical protein
MLLVASLVFASCQPAYSKVARPATKWCEMNIFLFGWASHIAPKLYALNVRSYLMQDC